MPSANVHSSFRDFRPPASIASILVHGSPRVYIGTDIGTSGSHHGTDKGGSADHHPQCAAAAEAEEEALLASLGPNAAIGYRRRPRGGFWMAGEYLGEGRYREEQIGVADDHLDADGNDVLDFEQAKAKAAAKIASWRSHDSVRLTARCRPSAPPSRPISPPRRSGARRQGITRAYARSRMRRHVLDDGLADIPLHELTEQHLVQWRERRPAALAPATVRRISIDLRSALNPQPRPNG